MTKQQLINYFIDLLNHLEIKTSPKYTDSIFYLYKDKLYIEYDQKKNTAWLDFDRIWSVFKSNYSNKDEEIQELTQSLVEEHLKLKGIRTSGFYCFEGSWLEEHLKLRGVTAENN